MREILFRGQDKITGEWVVSDGIYQNINPMSNATTVQLHSGCYGWVSVDPETVGQFTGLYDKNGTRIFEGDILTSDFVFHPSDNYRAVVKFGNFNPKEQGAYELYGLYLENHFDTMDGIEESMFTRLLNMVYVIGNIHDNPELLEEQVC